VRVGDDGGDVEAAGLKAVPEALVTGDLAMSVQAVLPFAVPAA